MSGQKFNLYSKALCVSGREEIAAINGLEVSVIGYRNAGDLGHVYTVSHEAKLPRSFECYERELRPVTRATDHDPDDPYAIIRIMLGRYLHQDFDILFDSVADAIHAAIRQTDKVQLARAIERLERESDSVISNVLGDHEVSIWEDTTPRELLVTIKTLLNLS